MSNFCIVITLASLLLGRGKPFSPSGGQQNVSKESMEEVVSRGYIIVAGGYNSNSVCECYAYNIAAGTWSALPSLPSCRHGGALVTHQGSVYYTSGYSTENEIGFNDVLQLSTKQSQWIQVSPLRTIASAGTNAVSLNNSIYVLGADTNVLEQNSICGICSLAWNVVASSLKKHLYSGAAALNGKIYVCGTVEDPSTFCESYDPADNQFSPITPMNEARHDLSMVALNGYLYVIGGAEANNERYDPVKDEWTYFSSVTNQKYDQAAATDGVHIYVVGGDPYLNTVSMYVPELDIWQSRTPYPLGLRDAAATFVKSIP